MFKLQNETQLFDLSDLRSIQSIYLFHDFQNALCICKLKLVNRIIYPDPYLCGVHFLHAELDRLVSDLMPVAAKWKDLGIQLSVGNLENISDGFSSSMCLRLVVIEWLNNSPKSATREVLKEAIEKIGHKRLANRLSSKLPEGLLLVVL